MGRKQTLAVAIGLSAVLIFFYFWRKSGALSYYAISAPAKKWEFSAGERVSGALALADDGTIYAASEDGFVYALDAYGTLQWKTYIGATKSSPSIGEDGAIYVFNGNGRVFALNRSGVVRWSNDPYEGSNGGGEGSSALSRDYLYAPLRGGLYAIHLTTGEVDWQSRWGGEQRGCVTLLPSGILLSPGHGRLTRLDSRGAISWLYPALSSADSQQDDGFAPPGDLYVTSGVATDKNQTLYAAVARSRMVAIGMDGSLKWELKTHSSELNLSTPVISSDGTIFFGSSDANLYALDSLGATKWTLYLDGPIYATPVLAQDGSIFVLSGNYLSVISPEGHLLSRVEVASGGVSSPTLAPDGTIYIAASNGNVIAFAGGHGALMNSPWPKYQADLSNYGHPRSF